MTSKIKVDNINKVSDDSNIIKKCGTTTTIGSGASNPIVVDGSAITLGRCGGTVALASGATQTGFGRTGTVNWNTTKKTTNFTATSGSGFFVDTSSGAVTVTLPASPSAGDIVSLADYAGTATSNNINIARNGSNMEGNAADSKLDTNRDAVTLIFVDATQGWVPVNNNTDSVVVPEFVAATGGTIKTSGNFKTHIFTGPGTFAVSSAGNGAGSNTVDYFVVAGGGGTVSGGAGAGGFRVSNSAGCVPSGTMSPLSNPLGLPVSVQSYSVTVGGGGAAMPSPYCAVVTDTYSGNPSTFSTITSTGGGHGQSNDKTQGGGPGGSGGGGGRTSTTTSPAGTGNTPPVSPPQGNNGGSSTAGGSPYNGGGGGGAGTAATPTPGTGNSPGGDGSFVADAFIGGCAPSFGEGGGPVANARYFAGGGGGGSGGPTSPGGLGGGGDGKGPSTTNGLANMGAGAGGGGGSNSGSGGSGIIMIRYKFQ
jgi:hypothetical protein